MKKFCLLICCIVALFSLSAVTASANQTGDLDGNNAIEAADARLALRLSVGLETLSDDARLAADVDADGKVLSADARKILRVSVGLDVFTGDFTITFIDVGQADSILIACGEDTMLIDGGNVDDGPAVCDFLEARGIQSLDYVICTHAHEDHVGGLTDVLESFTVTEAVFAPALTAATLCYRNFRTACSEQDIEPYCPSVSSSFTLGSSTVTVLGPALLNNTDVNNSSIAVRICYKDTAFVLTGDAEAEAEQAILATGNDVSATLFKAGHHGSSTSNSSAFLKEVMPAFAVISCGEGNSYGHPHTEVLHRFSDFGCTVFRTDTQGNITVVSNGQTLAFTTEKDLLPEPTPDPDPEPTPDPDPEPTGSYIGNINSRIFHLPTCSSLPIEKNRVYFSTVTAAEQAGYTPCSRCKP